MSYSTTYSISLFGSAGEGATRDRLSWKMSSSSSSMDGDDGTSMSDMDESKEPASDAGLDGIVRDRRAEGASEGAVECAVEGSVFAPAEGAGGMMTEEAARDSSAEESGRMCSATTMLREYELRV